MSCEPPLLQGAFVFGSFIVFVGIGRPCRRGARPYLFNSWLLDKPFIPVAGAPRMRAWLTVAADDLAGAAAADAFLSFAAFRRRDLGEIRAFQVGRAGSQG